MNHIMTNRVVCFCLRAHSLNLQAVHVTPIYASRCLPKWSHSRGPVHKCSSLCKAAVSVQQLHLRAYTGACARVFCTHLRLSAVLPGDVQCTPTCLCAAVVYDTHKLFLLDWGVKMCESSSREFHQAHNFQSYITIEERMCCKIN